MFFIIMILFFSADIIPKPFILRAVRRLEGSFRRNDGGTSFARLFFLLELKRYKMAFWLK